MPFDLRPTIADAALRFGGGAAGAFDSASFAEAVRARFDLARIPDAAWCARALAGRADVVRFGPHDVWRLVPAPVPVEAPTC